MFRKSVYKIFSFLLIFFFFHGIANADKSGVIKISKFSGSSQLVGSEIIGKLLEMIGEKVEYISTNKKNVYQLLASGEIDIIHEAYGELYFKELNNGGIEEIELYDAVLREDWWYPRYVERTCPGLPDWKALNSCSEKFSREDTAGKGLFFTGPAKWENHDIERIESLGMNFIVKNLDSAESIWAKLDKAVKEKKPIVIYNWSPNFIGSKYSGKFVEFPKYDPKCTTDETWGINPNALYDCGNPANNSLRLAVNINFKTNHSKAYKVIKNITFSMSELNRMSYYVEWFKANSADYDGLKESHGASQWMKDYEKKWSQWIK